MDKREFTKQLIGKVDAEAKVNRIDQHAGKLFEKGRYSEASKYYAQAFEMEKQPNARAYYAGQVGICNYNLERDSEALRNLQKSVRLFDPDKPEFMNDMYGFVHFHLGSIYEYQGKVAKSLEARRVCEQYILSQEKDTTWMLFAGISRNYESMGRHDAAIKYYQKAIQVLSDDDPGLAYLYESMANNHKSLQEYGEAIKYYSKVLDLDPGFERKDEIYLRIADCYLSLTNDRMAAETYEKILELKKLTGRRENLSWVYAKIARCYFSLEQFEKSLLMALEGLRRRPRDAQDRAEIRSYLTSNYYELGRYRDSIEEGEETLKLARRFPNSNLFYFRLALSYHRLGDKKHFGKFRVLCRRMFPDDSWNKYLDKLK